MKFNEILCASDFGILLYIFLPFPVSKGEAVCLCMNGDQKYFSSSSLNSFHLSFPLSLLSLPTHLPTPLPVILVLRNHT